MIVKVKQRNYKGFIVKFVAFSSLIFMGVSYYFYMEEKIKSEEFAKEENSTVQLQKKRALDIEDVIYKEGRTAVDLISQDKVRTVRIISGKLYIATDPDASLDSLMVRYGATALIKVSTVDKKIAIDLKEIVESRYDGLDL